jgi:hypothetical protein
MVLIKMCAAIDTKKLRLSHAAHDIGRNAARTRTCYGDQQG